MIALESLPMDLIGRILLAAFLGGLMGVERDLRGRPAGLRTNMIIAIGACLFTILSSEGFTGGQLDSSRIAAGIVTGVGFIGAGVVFQQQNTVQGLTTAADIWLVAAVGMAVGAGMYALGTFVALFTILALIALAPLSHKLAGSGRKKS